MAQGYRSSDPGKGEAESLVLMIADLFQGLCLGSLPDPATGQPQGDTLALTGPSATTVLDTAYGETLELVRPDETRGHRFPPGRSQPQVQ